MLALEIILGFVVLSVHQVSMPRAASDKEPSDGESHRQGLSLRHWIGVTWDRNSETSCSFSFKCQGFPSPKATASMWELFYVGKIPAEEVEVGHIISHGVSCYIEFGFVYSVLSFLHIKYAKVFKLSKAKILLKSLHLLWDVRQWCFTHKIRLIAVTLQPSVRLASGSSALVYSNTRSAFFLSFHLMSSGLLTPNTSTCSEVYKTNGASFFQRQWHFKK